MEDFKMYNGYMFSKLFDESLIHTNHVQTKGLEVDELQGWFNDLDFNDIKEVVVGCFICLTININLQGDLATFFVMWGEVDVSYGTFATIRNINLAPHYKVDFVIVTIIHSEKSLKLKKGNT